MNRNDLIKELYYANSLDDSIEKDIIIVVHNQLEYIKQCIESIEKTTKNYNLFIWDNNSNEETKIYLKTINNAIVVHSDINLGFIIPNNELIKLCKSKYTILLNSDVYCIQDWDKLLVGWLENNNQYKLCGYMGGILNETMIGQEVNVCGESVDYLCGWCICGETDFLKNCGPFDSENLKFAYGEDSDLSFRVKEMGWKIYVLNAKNVYHFGGMTTKSLNQDIIQENFGKNHNYLLDRWKSIHRRQT